MRDRTRPLSTWVHGFDPYEHCVPTKEIAEEILALETALDTERAGRTRLREKLDALQQSSGGLTLNAYQARVSVLSQWQPNDPEFGGERHKLYCAIKLGEESGEAAAPIAKHVFNNQPENPTRVLEELGDALWFIQEQARAHGFTLQQVAEANCAKLERRYPNGYSHADSLARRDKEGT